MKDTTKKNAAKKPRVKANPRTLTRIGAMVSIAGAISGRRKRVKTVKG